MSKVSLKAMLTFVFLTLLAAGQTFGLSFSTAVGYGQASHLDDNEYMMEWIGNDKSNPDGITYSDFVTGQMADIWLNVSLDNIFDVGSSEWLHVWADWNQDKDFSDDELILDLDDCWFDNGQTAVNATFQVPDWALTGDTWIRARLTADGAPDPYGELITGEVEDYRVPVSAVPEPGSMVLFAIGVMWLSILVGRGRQI